eukprot:TRINITY_DN1998_c0_g1_i20.p1 TRINITY_DN1998_c0_g1~~TRINITY_DN1998_c0_g1_i20.p1  ORF type:complete len:265 (-),score=86.99 TRINITY_DN1998_c0_g1_i20:167-961(-)
MYMLLSGEPPFDGNSNEEIMRNVEIGKVSYSGPEWNKISKTSIALLKKMLTYDPKKRITAESALRDPWFAMYDKKKNTNSMQMLECIKSLRAFRVTSTMQKAVLSYMASHIISKEEEKKLREIFTALDQKHNGYLTIEELAKGYLLLFKGDLEAAKAEAKQTMKRLDINGNGTIDYNEFLMANMDRNNIINEGNLKIAFDFFDANHDGNISVAELQRVFCGIKGEDILVNIMGDSDTNNDGQISYSEFVEMMSKHMKHIEQNAS